MLIFVCRNIHLALNLSIFYIVEIGMMTRITFFILQSLKKHLNSLFLYNCVAFTHQLRHFFFLLNFTVTALVFILLH